MRIDRLGEGGNPAEVLRALASLAAEPPLTPRHAGCPRSARFLGRVPAARAGYASGRSGGRALVAARCAV